MALPIYTHIPNLKGLTKIFFKLSRPKGNLCGGGMTVLNPKYPRLSSGDTIISSQLHYCYPLLYGVSPNSKRFKMPFVELFLRLDRTSQVTSFLQKLHWLPITYRILFKYNLITFKAIRFSQPTNLSSLIKTSSLTHGNRLSLSSVCPTKAIGRRGFTMTSPTE